MEKLSTKPRRSLTNAIAALRTRAWAMHQKDASLLGSVDLCCANVAQQYIGSHININASDTILA